MFTEFENQILDICVAKMSDKERLYLNIGLSALLREIVKFCDDVDYALEIKQKFSSL